MSCGGARTTMILQRSSEGVNSSGSITEVWSDIAPITGVLTSKSVFGAETSQFLKPTVTQDLTFIVAPAPKGFSVYAKDRLRLGGILYDITLVNDPDNSGTVLEISLQTIEGVS